MSMLKIGVEGLTFEEELLRKIFGRILECFVAGSDFFARWARVAPFRCRIGLGILYYILLCCIILYFFILYYIIISL